jgi:hypothetical protein
MGFAAGDESPGWVETAALLEALTPRRRIDEHGDQAEAKEGRECHIELDPERHEDQHRVTLSQATLF